MRRRVTETIAVISSLAPMASKKRRNETQKTKNMTNEYLKTGTCQFIFCYHIYYFIINNL